MDHYACSTEKTIVRDFLEILKHSLQNFKKILKKCFLATSIRSGNKCLNRYCQNNHSVFKRLNNNWPKITITVKNHNLFLINWSLISIMFIKWIQFHCREIRESKLGKCIFQCRICSIYFNLYQSFYYV